MSNKRILIYILSTFTITYTSWYIYAIYIHQIGGGLNFSDDMGIWMLLGLMGPTVSAYLAIALTRSDGGFKAYHDQFKPHLGWKWPLVALTLPVLLGGIGFLIGFLSNSELASQPTLQSFYTFIPAFFSSIIFGGLEEFGWRGLLLPLLLARFGFYCATLLTGATWILWHIPLFFIPDSGQYGSNFAIYALELIGYSAILTWMYIQTKSVLLAIVFHASFNAVTYIGLYAPKTDLFAYGGYAVVLTTFGFVLIAKLNLEQRKKKSKPQTSTL
ncbi:CPBP family intramembrane glutamic endopeptidase [Paenibacillus assamensis]|uniref:CPBP family intramembrane glutamic endopeptidase n=1 Tax=Paenibacillus assamensis TaxID=311244 RepID=UPI00040169CC|nr:CPBP family intramembrane glutamic endopeptidase [Paenibacillus assamensis]